MKIIILMLPLVSFVLNSAPILIKNESTVNLEVSKDMGRGASKRLAVIKAKSNESIDIDIGQKVLFFKKQYQPSDSDKYDYMISNIFIEKDKSTIIFSASQHLLYIK